MAKIELKGVTRDSGGTRILDDVSLRIEDGEFVTLIGHSGAGKSSVLRAIAGLDPITAGMVLFDGSDVTTRPTAERDIGMVTQQHTLFPTHKVRRNLLFSLRGRGVSKAEAAKRVQAETRAQNIEHLLDRWPETLSGGEQRLTEIARALVRLPKVFLMDEPLAQLDIPVRRRLRSEIVELQKGYGVTMVYASNWPEEILTMPDRLIALDQGRVVQTGTPAELRQRPATLAIAELTGPIGRLAVTVEPDDEGFWIVGDGVRLRAWHSALARHIGAALTLAARAVDVQVAATGPLTMVTGAKTFVESSGAIELRSAAGVLHTYDTDLGNEQQVSATLDQWHLFDEGGRRIMSTPS